jgi:hypothetical protein
MQNIYEQILSFEIGFVLKPQLKHCCLSFFEFLIIWSFGDLEST